MTQLYLGILSGKNQHIYISCNILFIFLHLAITNNNHQWYTDYINLFLCGLDGNITY